MCVHIILHMQHENYNKVNMWFDDVKPGPLTWEIPDSNSSGFSPLGFTILALVLNMAFVSAVRNKENMWIKYSQTDMGPGRAPANQHAELAR